MNLIQACNAPTPVEFGGRVLPVRQLKLREWAQVHAWLSAAAPNPVYVAARAVEEARRMGNPFSADLRTLLLEQAHDEARAYPPPVGSRLWLREVCRRAEGERLFYRTVFSAGGVELSDEDLDALVETATEEQIAEVLRLAYFGDPPVPKAWPPWTGADRTAKETTTNPACDPPTTGPPSSTG